MKKVGKILVWSIGSIVGLAAIFIIVSSIIYSPQYVYRLLAWQESDVYDYLHHFPSRSLHASDTPYYFENGSDEEHVSDILKNILEVEDVGNFMEQTDTQAFIVIQNDTVLYEKYFNGTDRGTLATSFSVAKSFTSSLIGIAIAEGRIKSVNEPITNYIPELLEQDPRFQNITIRNLLMMASGLDFKSDRPLIVNGDDALTTYYPDQRKAAIEFTKIVDEPGKYFQYNKYHPQLLGIILERATGMTVTEYLQEKLWNRIGMEFDGSWSIDSEKSGFEKMESGINARPIDFAKLGRLFLENGNWDGAQVIPSDWVSEATQVDRATYRSSYYPYNQEFFNSGGYYKYMWWGFLRGEDSYDFSAEGDRGQMIYVSPSKQLIIVRNGFSYGGIDWMDWLKITYELASDI